MLQLIGSKSGLSLRHRLVVLGLVVLASSVSGWSLAKGSLIGESSKNTLNASGCLPVKEGLMLYAQRLATDPDSIMDRKRTLYDIAMVPLSEVEAIANGSLCAKAGREYKRALGLSGPAPDVELVRIGDRYIAVNHNIEEPGSEFTLYLVLNAQMKEVAGFAA